MSDSLQNNWKSSLEENADTFLSAANSSSNLFSGNMMNVEVSDTEFLSSQQISRQLRSQESSSHLSTNNTFVSYSTAMTLLNPTQISLPLQTSQWIPAFPFQSTMSLSHRAKMNYEAIHMNEKLQKKINTLTSLNGFPSECFSQNLKTDLANTFMKSNNDNFSIDSYKSIEEFSSLDDSNKLHRKSSECKISIDRNPIALSLKQFLKDYEENQKRKIYDIPHEIINFPYFDIKQKKSYRKWESLSENIKHSKDILDRLEWIHKSHDSLLFNIPMFKGEDVKEIGLTAVSMGNCSFASCIHVERLPFDDPESERQRKINPLRSSPILIKFDSAANRLRFIKEFNQRRITVADFKYILKTPGCRDDPVYCEENLSVKNREILQKVENLKRLKTIHSFKIDDGRLFIYMNELDTGSVINDLDGLYDVLNKRVISLQPHRLLYKQQVNSIADPTFNEYFEKWFKIKNDLIEDILET